MQNPFFTYRASCKGVIDGDTIDLEIDLGFRMCHNARVRLAGVDTHEVHGVSHDSEEFEMGEAESAFVKEWMHLAQQGYEGGDEFPLLVSTVQDRTGKYGRYLADIYRRDTGASLTDDILKEFPSVAD